MGAETFRRWDAHVAKATWPVNARGSADRAGPAQSNVPGTVEGDKVPAVCLTNMLGRTAWVVAASGQGQPTGRSAFAHGTECPWWVMWKDMEVCCVPLTSKAI